MQTTERPEYAPRNLNFAAWAGGVLLLLATVLYSWQSWLAEKEEQVRTLSIVMKLVANATDFYLGSIENHLKALADEVAAPDSTIDFAHSDAAIRIFGKNHSELLSIALVDRQGNILGSAGDRPEQQISKATNEATGNNFLIEADAQNAVEVGQPLAALPSKEFAVPIRYVVRDGTGQMRFALQAILPVDVLENLLRNSPINHGAEIGLIRDDGILLGHHTSVEHSTVNHTIGMLLNGALVTHLKEKDIPSSGHTEGSLDLDGPAHLTAYQRLARFPVTLYISAPLSVVRAAWWEKIMIPYVLTTLLFGVGFVAYVIAAQREQDRHTQQFLAEEKIKESEARYARVLNGSNQGFWDWNLTTQKINVSSRFTSMLGYRKEEWALSKENWQRHVHPEDINQAMQAFEQHLQGLTDYYEAEYRMRTKNGETVWILSRGKVITRDEAGNPLMISGTYTDVSNRKRLEENLREMASTDFLTGVFNRRHFSNRLDEELARVQRMETQTTAVVMLDLDHFKRINDTYGHAAGDAVLRMIGNLLREELRKIDAVGRLGGEEFAIVLPGTDAREAALFSERLRQKIASTPAIQDDRVLHVTVSIGIALIQAQDKSAESVLSRADQALYHAKVHGRDRVEVAETLASEC